MSAAGGPAPISAGTRAAHLFGLSVVAVGAPLLDLLAREPTFLVAHGLDGPGTRVLAAGLCIGLPALLWLATGLVGPWRGGLHRMAVGLLVAVFVSVTGGRILARLGESPALSGGTVSLLLVVLAIAAGFVAARRLHRAGPWCSFLAVLAPLMLVVPVRFLLQPGIRALNVEAASEQSIGTVENRVPVVLLILDELPLYALETPEGTIDADRFPGFARLASTSTWFREATTVAQNTNYAVPAILTGRMPRARATPTVGDYPENLFTLAAGQMPLHVIEPMTALCPTRWCDDEQPSRGRWRATVIDLAIVFGHMVLPPALRGHLPAVDRNWGGFADDDTTRDDPEAASSTGRSSKPALAERQAHVDRFRAWLRDAEPQPAVYFLHLLLPHVPWQYLPDGQRYVRPKRDDTLEGLRPDATWGDDPWPVAQAEQRFLLQLAHTDRLLDGMLEDLSASGLGDQALLIVVADHGRSFLPGTPVRRVNDTNAHAVVPVPLFVRWPGQRTGRIDDRPARTVDILPTIASVLGVPKPWPVDGYDLHAAPPPPSARLDVFKRAKTDVVRATLDRARLRAGRQRLRVDLSRRFGPGVEGLFDTAPASDQRAWLGRPLTEIALGAARLDDPPDLEGVDPGRSAWPLVVDGWAPVEGQVPVPVAVAVAGTIRAVTRTVPAGRRGREAPFRALLPPSVIGRDAGPITAAVVERLP